MNKLLLPLLLVGITSVSFADVEEKVEEKVEEDNHSTNESDPFSPATIIDGIRGLANAEDDVFTSPS
jgi:hypothetical protein